MTMRYAYLAPWHLENALRFIRKRLYRATFNQYVVHDNLNLTCIIPHNTL